MIEHNLGYLLAYRNKISNKLFGTAHLPAQGAKKGNALLSYMTGPFTRAPGEFFTDPHTNYWECFEIARLLSERGYAVDCINAGDATFLPRKSYAICIDVQKNLARFAGALPPSCKKVMHLTTSDGASQNAAERTRLDNLAARRGVHFAPTRREEESRNPVIADYLEGFGNDAVKKTYAKYHKEIYPIPLSVSQEFPFPNKKDFAAARMEFLWAGGGGAVLKGLDLVVEAFAAMPEFTLHMVGPAAFEKGFAACYAHELSLPNIKRYARPHIDVEGRIFIEHRPYEELANRCAAFIYPSASEGTSGAVVQGVHAGLIPLITPRTGLDSAVGGITLPDDPTVASIQAAVRTIAAMTPDTLRTMARQSWEFVRSHHTKETFSRAYGRFLDDIVKI